MKLELKHTAHTIRNGTYYIFEIWAGELTKDLYEEIKLHPQVFVSHNLQERELTDHCQFLTYSPASHQLISTEETRVSIACLCHLTFENKTILFFKDGKAKPFGGALWFKEKCSFIKKYATSFDNDSSNDLRFNIKVKHLPKLFKWVQNKQGRELNPIRELKEELTLENLILSKTSWSKLEETFQRQGLTVFKHN